MKRIIFSRCLYLALACGMTWSGCGDSSTVKPDLEVAMVTRTVTGTVERSHFSDRGIVEKRAIDVTAYTFAAFVQDGVGKFTRLPGSGDASGHFSIPAVPIGEYYLLFQEPERAGLPASQKWLHTAADHLDMGQDIPGRPDLVRATASPTELVTNLSPMQPWEEGDDVQFFSANLDSNYALTYGNLRVTHGWPAPGDAALTDLRFDLTDRQRAMPLLDGGKDDHLYVAHMHYSPAANLSSLTDFFDAGTATTENGQETPLSGQFSPVAQDKRLHLNWQLSAFAAQAPAMSGQPLTGVYSNFNLSLMPWGSAAGFIGSTPDLLGYFPGTPSSDVSVDLNYGNPYPSAWAALYWAAYVGSVEYQAPGSEQPSSLFVSQAASSAALPTLVQPLVGPATQFKVNGQDAFTTQSGIGLTPTLTWRGPSVGRADGYEIVVRQLYSDASMRSQSQLVATLTTTKTTATLPPGVLAKDTAYLIKLTAILLPTVDMNRAPFRRGLPAGHADAVSAVLQVN